MINEPADTHTGMSVRAGFAMLRGSMQAMDFLLLDTR